ncbi:hypothetical protein [Streptomyces sp. Isolate_45]|uniref:hypothetical protein n=1 Tax=unclassified Streptomyces TaxID=2593676 RepID=UPI002481DA5E|nr:hypothetical protein [Streptomyces sp. Isolate_45]MDA5283464.1 hypothetical protein [Streptomyces sp. Isolate_45]
MTLVEGEELFEGADAVAGVGVLEQQVDDGREVGAAEKSAGCAGGVSDAVRVLLAVAEAPLPSPVIVPRGRAGGTGTATGVGACIGRVSVSALSRIDPYGPEEETGSSESASCRPAAGVRPVLSGPDPVRNGRTLLPGA